MISVAGRPKRRFEASVTVKDGCLFIKLDDSQDAEWWIELVVDDEDTERLVVEWCQCLTETVITLGDFEMRQ